jgi:hypothetical protein
MPTPPTYEWPKTAVEIINELDDHYDVGWDTDSNIALLTGFIEQHCDPALLESYVRAIAIEESKQKDVIRDGKFTDPQCEALRKQIVDLDCGFSGPFVDAANQAIADLTDPETVRQVLADHLHIIQSELPRSNHS